MRPIPSIFAFWASRRNLAGSGRPRLATLAAALLCLSASFAEAALPRAVARAFAEAQIPLTGVSAYVREVSAAHPAFTQQPRKAMNPASAMKLVTTYAALELLGPDYRWKTEAYADGPIKDRVLDGNLVLKGYGDPKITLDQFAALVQQLRAAGVDRITGDLVLDRSFFALPAHDPGAFDAEPLKPYNVGPDALLVNFKSVRFVFSPDGDGGLPRVTVEPALTALSVAATPTPGAGECGDWHAALAAAISSRAESAEARFAGQYPVSCGERDWYVSVLDHPHYVLGVFERAWGQSGGSFGGRVRESTVPPRARLIATLGSFPLYDVVRDINKLSNNVMARQVFLTLANSVHAPPATTALATEAVHRWLAAKKLKFPELVLENGAGLSRRERISAESMGRLLLAANQSPSRAEFIGSLGVAGTDGTVRKRFVDDDVGDHAYLKTGTLEGVRAIAGYVDAANGRRFVVVCLVNHANAARAQAAIDLLVQHVYHVGAAR